MGEIHLRSYVRMCTYVLQIYSYSYLYVASYIYMPIYPDDLKLTHISFQRIIIIINNKNNNNNNPLKAYKHFKH